MTGVTLDVNNGDIFIDEQTALRVTVNTIFSDGTPRDITDASVVWVATCNGEQKGRKDTATMQIMLAPQTLTTIRQDVGAGDTVINVAKVATFGVDGFFRPIADFIVGDYVVLTDPVTTLTELAQIKEIDANALTVTLESPTEYAYVSTNGATFMKIISQFSFILLPGDTILPANKVLGTKMVWEHLAMVTYQTTLSPQNIDAIPISVVAVRGDMFIDPIPDMSP